MSEGVPEWHLQGWGAGGGASRLFPFKDRSWAPARGDLKLR